MLKRIEAMLFGGRWRRDERAWGVWQGIEPLIPTKSPGEWETMSMAGRVVRIYQHSGRVVEYGEESSGSSNEQ